MAGEVPQPGRIAARGQALQLVPTDQRRRAMGPIIHGAIGNRQVSTSSVATKPMCM